MKPETLNRVTSLCKILLVAAAVLYLTAYVLIAVTRLTYPFELEWREGGSVDQVARILAGHQLYVSPSLAFVPYTYTPLYFYLSAAVAKVIGLGFAPLRLVSFLSSLGSLALILLLVKRETSSGFYGVLAAGLFSATYRASGAWLDIARVDSLGLVLLLPAIYLVRFGTTRRSYVLAGVLVWLSFLAKQTALAISLPIMLYCVWAERRRAVFFVGTVLGLVGLSTFALNAATEGWYAYYVWRLPSEHSTQWQMLTAFWTQDVLVLFVAFALTLLYLVAKWRQGEKRAAVFWFLCLSGLLAAAWMSRLSNGGYNNALIPAYAGLSIMFGLGICEALRIIRLRPEKVQVLAVTYLFLVCLVQFGILRYNPTAQVPTQADTDAGRYMLRTISEQPGEVFIPSHGYLAELAGKRSYGCGMAIFDMQQDSPIRAGLIEEIRAAIRQRRFDSIVLDAPSSWFSDVWFPEVYQYYQQQGKLFDAADVFWPVTGMRTRPQFIVVPKS
jgi:4-amino-4-deoxy-L-arabinose transferase-like glycosyltransferase